MKRVGPSSIHFRCVTLAVAAAIGLASCDSEPPPENSANQGQAIQQRNFDNPLADIPPDCRDCPELVNIPAGVARMGLSRETYETLGVDNSQALRETPPFGLTIKRPFAMGKVEVTVAQYRAFVTSAAYAASKGCAVLTESGWTFDQETDWQIPGFDQSDDSPVVCVSPVDAQHYADWLSQQTGQFYALPRETQWEYAARAWSTVGQPWDPGQTSPCQYANGAFNDCDDGAHYTSPVGRYHANGFLLHDMLGNAAEITRDCW